MGASQQVLAGYGAAASSLDPETVIWKAGLAAAGGTLGVNSESLADALIIAIKATAYNSKIVALWPLLGSNLAAARMPLRDTLGVGISTNHNFVDADFSEATGLQGNGTTKYLESLIKPSQLGSGGNGGIGYWERAATGSDSRTPMGAYSTTAGNYFMLAFWNQPGFITTSLYWGGGGGASCFGGPIAGNNHYYGQRSSATSRAQYKDGSSLNTSSASDSAVGNSTNQIYLMAVHQGGNVPGNFWDGRAGVFYMTDGTLSGAEVTAFHSLLSTYLISPTGR